MPKLTIHIPADAVAPVLHFCREEARCVHTKDIYPAEQDDYGWIFVLENAPSHFTFTLSAQNEQTGQTYYYSPHLGSEVWCRLYLPELYTLRPAVATGHVNEIYQAIQHLIPDNFYLPETDITGAVTHSMLGATPLKDGRLLFSLFHPRAAQVYLSGTFNNWQSPGHPNPNPEEFIPLKLCRGYYDAPNIWLALITPAYSTREWEYAYFVQGGTHLDHRMRAERFAPDPMTRAYGKDFQTNNSRVINPSHYVWHDTGWKTPEIQDLVVYEASVYGMTQGTPGIPPSEQGTFRGLASLIQQGYFAPLGITALALMPTSEAPSQQGPNTMGYDPCGFASVERDFGTPDDLRHLVDTAHQHGLAVIADLVFNHTSNTFNPLWGLINADSDGGFYFSGATPWGNRVATEREEVQNYLIDVCKLLLQEYHIDGFRFDATHSSWMSHLFLQRLAHEIRDKGFKTDCLLIAENLPNEEDLNFAGYNGFTQWCDPFHDKVKALLREGVYQDWVTNDTNYLGDVFYFSKNFYAAHTNNVLNYCESHDENSVPFEVGTSGGELVYDEVKARKAKLGLFATAVALGQPMIYMGQEFGTDRPRNLVLFDWPDNPKENSFFSWTRRLLSLRHRHPGLKIYGYSPAEQGNFQWILGPWLDPAHGKERTVIGWRTSAENGSGQDEFAVLMNFGNNPVMVDLELGRPGKWVKLADIDTINDLPPSGNNHPDDPSALDSQDGRFAGFTLPESSGFIYKWAEDLVARR